MKQVFIWGTHVEITAAAASLNKPVFVAIRKGEASDYYWAQYSAKPKDRWVYPDNLPVGYETTNLHDHLEIYHENNHYDVVLTAGGLLPSSPPFFGESSAFVVL